MKTKLALLILSLTAITFLFIVSCETTPQSITPIGFHDISKDEAQSMINTFVERNGTAVKGFFQKKQIEVLQELPGNGTQVVNIYVGTANNYTDVLKITKQSGFDRRLTMPDALNDLSVMNRVNTFKLTYDRKFNAFAFYEPELQAFVNQASISKIRWQLGIDSRTGKTTIILSTFDWNNTEVFKENSWPTIEDIK